MRELGVEVKLSGPTDLAGFRSEARQLLAHQVPPGEVDWQPSAGSDSGDPASLAASRPRNVARAATAIVPASFLRLCEFVVLHRDPERFALLYRLLWRLVHEPGLRNDPVDADMLHAQHMAHAVRRDIHKMKANLKLRTLLRPDGRELHLGCHEPSHHVVEAVAPWLAKKLEARTWAVFTSDRSVRSADGRLLLGPGVPAARLPQPGATDATWLELYRDIFERDA